jgi:hypothetical protein
MGSQTEHPGSPGRRYARGRDLTGRGSGPRRGRRGCRGTRRPGWPPLRLPRPVAAGHALRRADAAAACRSGHRGGPAAQGHRVHRSPRACDVGHAHRPAGRGPVDGRAQRLPLHRQPARPQGITAADRGGAPDDARALRRPAGDVPYRPEQEHGGARHGPGGPGPGDVSQVPPRRPRLLVAAKSQTAVGMASMPTGERFLDLESSTAPRCGTWPASSIRRSGRRRWPGEG